MSRASESEDRVAIRDLIESWVLWRDTGTWDRLRTVWHDDGRMMATWFQGTADEFIAASRAGFARGVRAQHNLGGMTIDIAGNRAVTQTKMAILQRAPIEGVVCDFTMIGRFYDFLEKRSGRWGLVLRQPIYEKDRIDPVDAGRRNPSSIQSCSRAFPRATVTSPICRPGKATRSSPTCRARPALSSKRSTGAAPRGSPARRCSAHFAPTRRMNFSKAASCCLTMSMVG